VFRVRGLEVSAHPDNLGPGGEEVQDPSSQGGVQSQLNQLVSQSGGNYGVESRTKVKKQHSHIALLTVKMREGAVYNLGDSIVCGSVWLVVEGGKKAP